MIREEVAIDRMELALKIGLITGFTAMMALIHASAWLMVLIGWLGSWLARD